MARASQPAEDGFDLDISHLQIEDDEPVDNTFSEKQMRLLTESLYSSWGQSPEGPEKFAAFANVGLFYALNEPAIVPDVMVSLGILCEPDPEDKRTLSYFIWEHGKPPDIVIEVVSNKEGGEDTTKLKRYASIGVGYYAIFDPFLKLSRRPLRLFARSGNSFIDFVESGDFPGLGLGLTIWEGEYEGVKDRWLRWTDANKKLIPTGAEAARVAQRQASEAEQKALEAEQKTLEAEQKTFEAEQKTLEVEQRAVRLAAKLRELGLDPDES